MIRLPAAERREALLTAALRLMSRDGLAAGTTRAIVAEAGMSLASFHYAFDSREEMLAELVPRVVARELAAGAGELRPDEDVATCLSRAARGYLQHLAGDPGAETLMLELTVLAMRTPALQPLVQEQYRTYRQAAADLLDQVAALTGVRWRRPLPVLARLLVVLLDGATTTWLVYRDTEATRAALDSAVAAFAVEHAEQRG